MRARRLILSVPVGLFCVAYVLLLRSSARGEDREPAARMPCPYPTCHDAPLDATSDIVEDADNYSKFRVEFLGVKGDRVPAFLYVPKNGAAKHPAVLLQYGIGGDKKVDYIVTLGKQFVDHGFVVLTIDAPGRGERKSAQAQKRGGVDRLFGDGRDVFLQYCGDYSRAVDYLVARSNVDATRICYVGISWGAITGVTYVAHDARIKAMGSMVGGGNFLNPPGAAADSASGNKNDKPVSIDPVHHVGQIAPRPLLLLNVTKDQLVPRPFAEALHNAAGEGAKKVWLETDHYFSDVDRHAVGESVIRFLKENMAGNHNE
jgi:dienelactone hydrolase